MGLLDSAVNLGRDAFLRVMGAGANAMSSTRDKALDALDAVYWGRQYDGKGLAPSWDKAPPGRRRTPLNRQKPSVQYDLARLIVDRPTALLFGEGRFPEVCFEPHDATADATEINAWLAQIVDEGALAQVALTWSRQGGTLGTAVLTWCVAEGEFEFEAHKASQCRPTFHKKKRGRLEQLEKRYKFAKTVQRVDPTSRTLVTTEVPYWHRELWTEQAHIVYVEVPVGDGREPTWTVDDEVAHGLGFVPAVWVKNIDDGEPGNIDGVSLLDGLTDVFEDIDRTLTQKSRAVRYNQEPERVYFGLTEEQRGKIEIAGGGSSRSLPSKETGADVVMLELRGEGQRVAEEHIVSQRSRALDVSRVTAPEPERLLAAAKSGVALRMLFAPTLELVGELRQTYGRALRMVFQQILAAARTGALAKLGRLISPPPAAIPEGKVKLMWGRFFDPTPEDLDLISRSAAALKVAGLMDRETLVRWLSSFFGIKDIAAVMKRLDEDRDGEYGPMPNGAPPKPGAKPGDEPDADDKPTDDDEPDPNDAG